MTNYHDHDLPPLSPVKNGWTKNDFNLWRDLKAKMNPNQRRIIILDLLEIHEEYEKGINRRLKK